MAACGWRLSDGQGRTRGFLRPRCLVRTGARCSLQSSQLVHHVRPAARALTLGLQPAPHISSGSSWWLPSPSPAPSSCPPSADLGISLRSLSLSPSQEPPAHTPCALGPSTQPPRQGHKPSFVCGRVMLSRHPQGLPLCPACLASHPRMLPHVSQGQRTAQDP